MSHPETGTEDSLPGLIDGPLIIRGTRIPPSIASHFSSTEWIIIACTMYIFAPEYLEQNHCQTYKLHMYSGQFQVFYFT